MNTSVKMIAALTLIAILSGGVLSMWDSVTAPKIEENRLKVLMEAISFVLPEYDRYEELDLSDDIRVFVGLTDGSDIPVGLAFKAAGNGFSPDLTIMVGIQPDFSKLTGIQILEQTETPGLGNKIEEEWWKNQFKGLLIGDDPRIQVVKNKKPEDPSKGIQAISGATISSKAVRDIILNQVSEVRSLYQSQ